VRLPIRSLPVYPVALALTGLVTLFVNAGEPATALVRPLVAVVVAVAAVQLSCTLLLGGLSRGALATACLFLLVAGLWPLAAALLVLPAWWLGIALIRRGRGAKPPPPDSLRVGQRALNAFAVALLIVTVVSGALHGAFALNGPPAAMATPADRSALPNIYLVHLDGYPGFDAVQRTLGIDNEAFATALEDEGFDVVRDARSNYTETWPTLASLFQMAYLQDDPGFADEPGDLGDQRRRLARALNDGRALSELRRRGYHITTMPSAFASAALLSADTVIDEGWMNEFEEIVLRKSGVAGLLGDAAQSWVVEQATRRVEDGIAILGDLTLDKPTFFFDHILAPHPPFLFEADGSAPPLRDCYPQSCHFWITDLDQAEIDRAAYARSLQAELEYLNGRILANLRTLIERDPTAVVILYSDHGMRFDPADTQEPFEILFAARTPGRAGVFDDRISLVNLFPELFNAYFGTRMEIAAYRAWHSDGLPLNLREADPDVKQ